MKLLELLIERLVFASRWIQAPMYVGLIVASMLYCYKFLGELYHLCHEINHLSEEALMLGVLGLVDVTMVANLIFMVVIGGYSIFVSKLQYVASHSDRPEWLEKTNAASLKIKLAASLVGVSGIHLLKTFINIEEKETIHVILQVLIHVTFLLSSLALAISERILHGPEDHGHGPKEHGAAKHGGDAAHVASDHGDHH